MSKPTLYSVEAVDDDTFHVHYEPDDSITCTVRPREGEPPEDGARRAEMIADILNATVDMTSMDIRMLLAGYEEAKGSRFHADWRDEDE